MRKLLAFIFSLAISLPAMAQQGFDCTGLVTGSGSLGRTAQSRPNYNTPFPDPLYGTTTIRVTGNNGTAMPSPFSGFNWTQVNSAYLAHQSYSEIPAFDASDTYIYLGDFSNPNGLILKRNGASDYGVHSRTTFRTQMGLGSIPVWHPVEAATMYGVKSGSSNVIRKYNVATSTGSDLFTVTGYSGLTIPENRSGFSYDGKKMAFLGVRNSDGQSVCIGVNVETQAAEVIADLSTIGHAAVDDGGASCAPFKACHCRVSAKGEYLIAVTQLPHLGLSDDFRNNAHWWRWSDNAYIGRIPANTTGGLEGGNECPGHWDHGINQAGQDVIFGKCNGVYPAGTPPTGIPASMAGQMVTVRLSDILYTAVGPNVGGHSTCHNAQRPGWCFQSTFDSVNADIRAYKLDGSRIEHIANSYNNAPTDYWAQTQMSVGTTGKRGVWTSDWDSGQAHVYVTEWDNGCGTAPPPTCGNESIDPGEQCDPPNPTLGCSADCLSDETCGNSYTDFHLDPPEQCDDGNTTPGDGCDASCQLELCGDGDLDVGEACDDGNTVSGDGCSATCQIESPPPIPPPPSFTPPTVVSATYRGVTIDVGTAPPTPTYVPALWQTDFEGGTTGQDTNFATNGFTMAPSGGGSANCTTGDCPLAGTRSGLLDAVDQELVAQVSGSNSWMSKTTGIAVWQTKLKLSSLPTTYRNGPGFRCDQCLGGQDWKVCYPQVFSNAGTPTIRAEAFLQVGSAVTGFAADTEYKVQGKFDLATGVCTITFDGESGMYGNGDVLTVTANEGPSHGLTLEGFMAREAISGTSFPYQLRIDDAAVCDDASKAWTGDICGLFSEN